jgi:tetratricopeptide (TPR) repeat protein
MLQDIRSTAADSSTEQVVTVLGEAGVGKSRLLLEFMQSVPEGAVDLTRVRAIRERQQVPFALLRELLTQRAGILDSDPATVARSVLEHEVRAMLGDEQSVEMKAHVIGHLIGLDFHASPHVLTLVDDPRELRDRAMRYVVDYWEAACARRPVVILIEDAHWADESSLDALEGLSLALRRQPLMLVYAARMELLNRRPGWSIGQTNHTRVEVTPLGEHASQQLLTQVLGEGRVEEQLLTFVTQTAQGNPLFMEELLRMLQDQQVVVSVEGQWILREPKEQRFRVPPTLTRILQARLDDLGIDQRSITQWASVVGRTFWDGALLHVRDAIAPGLSPEAVQHALSELQQRGMVFPQAASAFEGTTEFMFKHVLVREAAYERMLKRTRRICHAKAAEWLMGRDPDRAAEYAGVIAEHLEAARLPDRAYPHYQRAGLRAMETYANHEAVRYLSRALELSPDDDVDAHWRLLIAREKAWATLGRRDEQRRDVEALVELARVLGDPAKQMAAAERKATLGLLTGAYEEALAAVEYAIDAARAAGDALGEARAILTRAKVHVSRSEYDQAVLQAERALSLAESVARSTPPGIERKAADLVQMHISSVLGLVAHHRGDSQTARRFHEQALHLARSLGTPREQGVSLMNLANTALGGENRSLARSYSEEALHHFRSIGDRQAEAIALNALGNVCVEAGDDEAARQYFEESLTLKQETGDLKGQASTLMNLGSLAQADGRYLAARQCYEDSLALREKLGDPGGRADSLGDLGLLALHLGDHQEAIRLLEQSHRLAVDTGKRLTQCMRLEGLAAAHQEAGEADTALRCATGSVTLARELRSDVAVGYTLTELGVVLEDHGQWAEAAAAYDEALKLREGLGQGALAAESRAGLARVAAAGADYRTAMEHVERILEVIEANALVDVEDAPRIYLTCCEILSVLGDPRARSVLDRAVRWLNQQTQRISDETQRRRFLERVPVRARLMALHRAMGPQRATGDPRSTANHAH